SFRDAGLGILRGGQRVFAASGDLLITHGGLSGPLVLDSSRHIAPGDTVEINFVHADPREFRARLDAELSTQPRRRVRTVLASRADLGLPKSMADLFCDLAGIPEEATSATLGRPQREALCRLACAHPFRVASLGSLESAMVTAGGVDLAEVNPRTMESRLVPGLFFAGEVLDIDGDTGGYNLQAAFSTGALAAKGISLRIAAVRGAASQIRP
ncbi:MAG TPA: NAD(P)/FAD-dependent oxidoreductase, partial [Rectinemataceae bacterium]